MKEVEKEQLSPENDPDYCIKCEANKMDAQVPEEHNH